MTKRAFAKVALIVVSLAAPVIGAGGAAEAKVVAYLSMHPAPGHGFCRVQRAHEHDYEPQDARLYRTVDGRFYFVGDPVPFGFHGKAFPYFGPHPVAESGVEFSEPAYCYLEGHHKHWYEPANAIWFERREGAFFYVGSFAPSYHARKTEYASVNEIYHPPVKARGKVAVKVKVRRDRGRHRPGGRS